MLISDLIGQDGTWVFIARATIATIVVLVINYIVTRIKIGEQLDKASNQTVLFLRKNPGISVFVCMFGFLSTLIEAKKSAVPSAIFFIIGIIGLIILADFLAPLREEDVEKMRFHTNLGIIIATLLAISIHLFFPNTQCS